MKKAILFITTILIINYTSAQEKVENYYTIAKGNIKEAGLIDKNGYPTGEWKYFLENGTLDYIINWETNFTQKFYTTGELKEKGTFLPDRGDHIGEWTTYYINGKLKTKKIYDKTGNLISSEHYKDELHQN